jgi:hypothetical protein
MICVVEQFDTEKISHTASGFVKRMVDMVFFFFGLSHATSSKHAKESWGKASGHDS